jgi:hypothetical protein
MEGEEGVWIGFVVWPGRIMSDMMECVYGIDCSGYRGLCMMYDVHAIGVMWRDAYSLLEFVQSDMYARVGLEKRILVMTTIYTAHSRVI